MQILSVHLVQVMQDVGGNFANEKILKRQADFLCRNDSGREKYRRAVTNREGEFGTLAAEILSCKVLRPVLQSFVENSIIHAPPRSFGAPVSRTIDR